VIRHHSLVERKKAVEEGKSSNVAPNLALLLVCVVTCHGNRTRHVDKVCCSHYSHRWLRTTPTDGNSTHWIWKKKKKNHNFFDTTKKH